MNTPGRDGDSLARLRGQRVLFLSEASAYGGHEAMALRAAALLSRHGTDVVFRMWQGNARLRDALLHENVNGAAVTLHESPVVDVRLNPLRSLLRRADIAEDRRYLRSESFNARVLVQGRIESGSVALLASRLEHVALTSYVPMAHRLVEMRARPLPRLRDAVNTLYYRAPHAYITISEAIGRQLRSKAPGAPVHVVENWISRPVLALLRSDARRQLGWPLEGTIVATIGRIDFQQKGHDWLISALQAHRDRLGDLQLAVVGDGPDLERLRDMVRDAGIESRVWFQPWVNGGMDLVYAAVNGLVLPSNYEGVPLVMLEALARRIPVAASAIDGMADWLPSRATFRRHDPADVMAALGFALSEASSPFFESAYQRALQRSDDRAYASAWAQAILALSEVAS